MIKCLSVFIKTFDFYFTLFYFTLHLTKYNLIFI